MLAFRRVAITTAVTLVAWACGTFLVEACGSANSGSNGFGGTDSGTAFDSGAHLDSGAPPDGGGPDAGPPTPTTALFVQGSPSLPDVRLCWGTASTTTQAIPFPGTGAMPGSNYPGIPLGGLAAMSDTSDLGSEFVLYAIDAENLARIDQNVTTPFTCEQLICGQGTQPVPCLRYNLDYWPVSSQPLTIVDNATNVVALTGCLPAALDPAATPATCGPSWTALSGNLHADVVQLQSVPDAGASGLAVQAVQLSPGLAALVGVGGTAVVSFGAEGATAPSPVATLSGEGQLSAATSVALDGGLAAYGRLGFSVDVPGYDGGAGHLWMSLAEAQQLIDPTQDPAVFFGQPRPYLVAVLGDPAAPHAFDPAGDAGYDGKGLHVLVAAAPAPPPRDE